MIVGAQQSKSKAAMKIPVSGKYIVVEGPIGVGKSSLARKLSNTYGAQLLLEKSEENPFLERFYRAPQQFALPTQLFFLFQRVQQISEMQQLTSSPNGCIADFMMDKDPLFAELNLDSDEYRLYQQVYQNLSFNNPVPDLVIYLQAPVQVLLERINRRRVKYEISMDLKYLQRLSDAYTEFFHRYRASALLMINAAEINPVDNESHFAALVNHINRIDAGKHFFNPLVEAL